MRNAIKYPIAGEGRPGLSPFKLARSYDGSLWHQSGIREATLTVSGEFV